MQKYKFAFSNFSVYRGKNKIEKKQWKVDLSMVDSKTSIFTFWGRKQMMKRLNYWIFGEKSGTRTKM